MEVSESHSKRLIALLSRITLTIMLFGVCIRVSAADPLVDTRAVEITIPSIGTATPYPFSINVAGYSGVLSDVNITLWGVTHTSPADISVLVVNPNGYAVHLMSGSCGGSPISGVDLKFDDDWGTTGFDYLTYDTSCSSGTYRPTTYGTEPTFPSPAPPPPYYDRLSIFDGLSPNGTWHFYVIDTLPGDSGFIDVVQFEFFTTPSLPNLIQNPGFTNGENNWLEFGGGTGSVAAGVYQFRRTSVTDAFTVFQTMTADIPDTEPFELRFDMGNSGSDVKRVTVLMWDEAFRRQRACSFWLYPNQPLRTYQILSDTPQAWTNTTGHFYAATTSTNGWYQLDNVIFRRRELPTALPEVYETLCIDPIAPPVDPIPGVGPNLIADSGFTAVPGVNPENAWAAVGNVAVNVSGGVLNMQRTGDPAGSVLQNANSALFPSNSLEFVIDLGNSSNQWQRVTILLHNENFDGLQFCTYWLPPNQTTLQQYRMRTNPNGNWDDEGVSVSIYPSTNFASILVDNVILRRRTVRTIGVGCYEPGTYYPAMEHNRLQSEFDALIAPTLLPTATGVPYTAPGMAGELSIIATPSAPIESGAMDEGTVSE